MLLYRLVSLPNRDNPWGDGLLLQTAREHGTDDALFFALGSLMQQRWCGEPPPPRPYPAPTPPLPRPYLAASHTATSLLAHC